MVQYLHHVFKRLIHLVCIGALMPAAWAQQVSDAPDQAHAVVVSAQQWVHQALAQLPQDQPLRTEVVVGRLDPRLQLASCQRMEPYLPPGSRLWGATRIGVRCIQGSSRWNVFVPITVKAFGAAWVIKGQVAPGTVLQRTDALVAEVDWATGSSPIIVNQTEWVGKTANRLLTTGQPLRQDMVRGTQVFQAGSQVRVVASGNGFEIAARGQAISAGVVGQSARVRMDNGQILQGQVSDSQTIRVLL